MRMPVGDVVASPFGADDFVVARRLRNGGGAQVSVDLDAVLAPAAREISDSQQKHGFYFSNGVHYA